MSSGGEIQSKSDPRLPMITHHGDVWTLWFGGRQKLSHTVVMEHNNHGKRTKQIVLINNMEVAVFMYDNNESLMSIRFAMYLKHKEYDYIHFDTYLTIEYENGNLPICSLDVQRGPMETEEDARKRSEVEQPEQRRRSMGATMHKYLWMSMFEGTRAGLVYMNGHAHLFNV